MNRDQFKIVLVWMMNFLFLWQHRYLPHRIHLVPLVCFVILGYGVGYSWRFLVLGSRRVSWHHHLYFPFRTIQDPFRFSFFIYLIHYHFYPHFPLSQIDWSIHLSFVWLIYLFFFLLLFIYIFLRVIVIHFCIGRLLLWNRK